MTYNRFENFSIDNALPCEEIEGQTYSRFQPISPTNPYPVMVVDLDAYTPFQPVSEANPLPIATGDGDAYTIFQELSEANRLPVVIVEGQSYSSGAEVSMTNPYPVINTTEEGGYTGPLDLVPGAVVAYGQRAMSAAMCGQPYATLRRASDDAELQFSFAADGTLDASAITTWAGGEVFGTIWNDGSGNNKHASQANTGQQPLWVASAQGSKPALRLGGANEQKLGTSGNVTFPDGQATVFAVIKAVGFGGSFCGENQFQGSSPGFVCVLSTSSPSSGFAIRSDGARVAQVDSQDAIPADYFICEAAWEFGTRALLYNGVEQSTTTQDNVGAPTSIAFPLAVGDDDATDTDFPFDGDIVELIIYADVLSSNDRSSLRQNIATYYGISL